MKGTIYYAVVVGRRTGVFGSWAECSEQVKKFPNARYKGFELKAEAEEFVLQHTPKKTIFSDSTSVKCSPGQPSSQSLQPVHVKYEPAASMGECSAPKRSKLASDFEESSSGAGTSFSLGPSTTKIAECDEDQDHQPEIHDLKKKLQLLKRGQEKLNVQIEEQKKGLIEFQEAINLLENKIEPAPAHFEPDIQTINPDSIQFNVDEDDHCLIYIGGCCTVKKCQKRAGVGVWFCKNSKLNISEPFVGKWDPTICFQQLQAATLALNVAKMSGLTKVNIHTDSKQAVKWIKVYMPKWKSNGWLNNKNKPVSCKDQLELLVHALEGMRVKWTFVKKKVDFGTTMANELAIDGSLRYTL